MKVNTNPEMNETIADILSTSTNPMHLYAAARIWELEAEVERLRREFDELYAEHVAVRDRINYERGMFRYD